MKTFVAFSLLLVFAFIYGCSDNTVTSTTTSNKISTRSVNDTMAIAIVAANYTITSEVPLYISTDSVNLNLAVSTYGGGTGMFKLFRQDTILVYSQSLDSVTQAIQLVLPFKPNKANVTLTNYIGTAAINVTKK